MEGKMKIPEKVKIGGKEYVVLEVYKNSLGDGKVAEVNFKNLTIEIDEACHPLFKEESLIHEILHTLFVFLNFDFDDEEDIVERLSEGIHMLIKDNPEMFEKEE
jgi:hypothetical protein